MALEHRATVLGFVDHRALADLYSAIDLLVLASPREGWLNVLLESLACGTLVVATRNWRTPEIVTSREDGCLINQWSAKAIADGVRNVLAGKPDPARTRAFTEGVSWDFTTDGQQRLFASCLRGRAERSISPEHDRQHLKAARPGL